MKIKYILPCIIWLTKSSLGKIILPSGVPVPEPLLSYFSCPIGNTICLNGNGRSCHYKYLEYCENDGVQAEKLAEDFDMGNFTPVEFCEVINDSCHYIDTYTPELYDSDVYDLDQYLTCGKSDTICQYGKRSGCKKALGKCWGSFPVKDCRKLSDTCDSIRKVYNDEVAVFTPDGTRLPEPLSIYFNCLYGDISCKRDETDKCYEHYDICSPDRNDDLINFLNNDEDLDYYKPEEYCEEHKKACEYIMEYNKNIKDDYIYDLDFYECENATTSCYYGKRASCRSISSYCGSKYPEDVCQKLSDKCEEIDNLLKATNPLLTPSGAEVPPQLYKYFDKSNINSKNNCLQEYSIYCEDRDQNKYTKLISNYDTNNMSYLEFCNVLNESCNMIDNDDKPTTTITRNSTTTERTTTTKKPTTTTKKSTTTKKPTTTTKKSTTTRKSTTTKKSTTTRKTTTRKTTTRKTTTKRITTKRTTTKKTTTRKTTTKRTTTRKTSSKITKTIYYYHKNY